MYSNKLITLFFLLPLLCHAVEFDETLYNDCKDRPMLCAARIYSPKGNNYSGLTKIRTRRRSRRQYK
ncbi:hypothetical protein COI28_04845 [Neisseria meningitidis]|nr:hypothetical protein COI28_04845 [Neisseria meningitidis]